ncbi:flagellar protein FlaG [Fictibacillus terranigra]|uniref:Flagellar protein FlaG n=1 Tax=Fictibacillus terranigra TaxID=3058424 RepID=A0ABT8E2B6_9BACL|nr:flagellar protein FlaG [Fictibacillus sp. CENA-BCM004]MDN4072030.1 flagellar protein FlaG [Fictibacillus sp. CENA-BCM004]
MEVQGTLSTITNIFANNDRKAVNKENKQSESIVHSEKVAKKDLEKMISGVNDLLLPTHTSSKFVLHEKLNDYYVQVIDDNTKEIVREIPSKKFLDMYASMLDFVGLFIDKKF